MGYEIDIYVMDSPLFLVASLVGFYDIVGYIVVQLDRVVSQQVISSNTARAEPS